MRSRDPRHRAASSLGTGGVPAEVAKTIPRHTDGRLTLNFCRHAQPEVFDRAVAAKERRLAKLA